MAPLASRPASSRIPVARSRKKKIVSTPIKHPSIIATLEHLRGRGLAVKYLPVDCGGHVMMEHIEELSGDAPSSASEGHR